MRKNLHTWQPATKTTSLQIEREYLEKVNQLTDLAQELEYGICDPLDGKLLKKFKKFIAVMEHHQFNVVNKLETELINGKH